MARMFLCWLLPGLLFSLPLQAHKLKLFVSTEGDQIEGRVYFVGGAGARGAQVRIVDAQDRVLAQLQPDEEGRFSHRIDRRREYRVVADSLDGHQTSWTLRGSALEDASAQAPGGGEGSAPGGQATTEGSANSAAALDARVERAVARQIRPLREALEAQEERLRLRDILGGFGYILGLAGLALWLRSRRRGAR